MSAPRRRTLHRVLLGLVLASLASSLAAAGPKRVASVNVAADEVLVEILPPERLIAVTRWVDDPSTSRAAGHVPRGVFRVQKADLESLVALRPDLVVVSEYTDADFQRLLERSGMQVHRMGGLRTLDGVRQALLELGRVVGEPAAANRLLTRFDAQRAELARRLAGARKPRVMYWSGDMTAGADTAIGALIEAAGGINVGRELGVEGIAPPGAERAFVADPDVVLVSSWPDAERALRQHPLLGGLRAVRTGHLVALDNALLVTLSHFMAEAAWQLAARLHPERVPAAWPGATPTPRASPAPRP